ncbi:hypothetical protein ABK040_001867 [Willaertia magna]
MNDDILFQLPKYENNNQNFEDLAIFEWAPSEVPIFNSENIESDTLVGQQEQKSLASDNNNNNNGWFKNLLLSLNIFNNQQII